MKLCLSKLNRIYLKVIKGVKMNFLTPSEVLKTYKISHTQQHKLRAIKDLPFYKIGKSIRYDEKEFKEWLESKREIKAV